MNVKFVLIYKNTIIITGNLQQVKRLKAIGWKIKISNLGELI